MAVIQTGNFTLPEEMAEGFISKVRDGSAIARLAPASASRTLLNERYNLVTTDPEMEWVGEGVAKTQGDMAFTSRVTGTYKFVGTLRFTDEVMWADEDTQMGLLNEGMTALAAAGSRALDYGIYHAVSPKGASAITGATALTTASEQETVGNDLVATMDGLPDKVIANGYEFNGIALAPTFANDLRKERIGTDQRRAFPEITLNPRQTSNVSGINAAVSSTVNGALITPATGIVAVGGDYDLIKWGLVREIPTRLIEYGDPDNTGRDLQGHNEVALRMELVYKWVVLDPKAFVTLKSA